ncbi:MAG TPA: hypothetical protein VM658_00045 [bacterium]|nr:hypothetical protein [bacterium]
MKALTWIAMLCLAAGLMAAACGEPPKVTQGIVVSYQPDTKTLVIKDSGLDGQEETYSLQGAEVGAEPSPGDELRLSYRGQPGNLTAIRVMNLTKQDELKGGGGH